jgi:adenine-specific DNA-methyltransferase
VKPDPWSEDNRTIFYRLRALIEQGKEANPGKVQDYLQALNSSLRRSYAVESLPARPADPWPPGTARLHKEWWEARIAQQTEIDASIAAKAESEYLYDKSYEDKRKVRVAGPFTWKA